MDDAAAGGIQHGRHPAAVDRAQRVIDRAGRGRLEHHPARLDLDQGEADGLGDRRDLALAVHGQPQLVDTGQGGQVDGRGQVIGHGQARSVGENVKSVYNKDAPLGGKRLSCGAGAQRVITTITARHKGHDVIAFILEFGERPSALSRLRRHSIMLSVARLLSQARHPVVSFVPSLCPL